MLRVVAAFLLAITALAEIPAAVPANVQTGAESSTQCLELSLEATFLCVSLSLTINGADHHEFAVIDWGDGTTEWVDCPGVPWSCTITIPHTYDTGGTYTIKCTAITVCPGITNSVVAQVQASPEFLVYAVSQGENWIQLGTSDPLDATKLRKSSIDWGDGNEVAEFEWFECAASALCTPRHDYASAGEYLISARLEYTDGRGGTCYERVATLQATIGTPTPIQKSTWGAIKALYR